MWDIAEKYKVDAVWLKGLGITDLDQLDKVAKGSTTKVAGKIDSIRLAL